MGGVRLDLLPKVADVDVQAVFLAIIARAPDGLAERVVGDDAAPVLAEPEQQGAFGRRQREPPRRAQDAGIREIDRDFAKAQRRFAGGHSAIGSPQDGRDAQEQLLRQKRLGQVVVRAQAKTVEPVGIRIPRGEKEHRDVGARGIRQRARSRRRRED